MRLLQNRLAAAITLALAAGAAVAATTTTTVTSTTPTGIPSLASRNGAVLNSGTTTSPTTSSSSGSTVTSTYTQSQAVSPPNATSVDLRNQQTLAATAGTHASGSTSAIDNLLAQGAASTNGSTTGTTTGTGTTGTGAVATSPFVGGYAFGNPSDLTSLPYANGAVPAANAATTLAMNTMPDVVANAQVTQFEAARADANVNRAIAQVQRDRKRVGRNGQLLYSIAPRTNVDRSAEMPDDGPPPSLTGSNSTLTR